MINVIKKEIDVEESLRKRLEIICDFCNTTPTIINGSIRKVDKTNLVCTLWHTIKKFMICFILKELSMITT